VSIVQSEVKTIGERVFDRFSVVELDGSPISPARRLQIQVAVMSAVEPQPTVVRRDARNGDRAKPAGSG
jgi:UTP:GlnB (protein PII) uridylyltransferase